MSRTVAIVQARTGSSRLPGKVLLPLGKQTVLGLMIKRLKKAKLIDEIVIATTDAIEDERVVAEAERNGVSTFRGSQVDVLNRYFEAAKQYKADVIIRLTADCPLIDGHLIDQAIVKFRCSKFDYLSNVVNRSFPDGLDFEIFTRQALNITEKECKDRWSREHVTPYMRNDKNLSVHAGSFSVYHYENPADFHHCRWTLDTLADYEFLCELVKHNVEDLGWLDIVALLMRHPDLLAWNRKSFEEKVDEQDRARLEHNGYTKSVAHLSRALEVIPVGSQTFSKSYLGWTVGQSPIYADSGSGAILTDIDGNRYIDYMMALLPVVLGYADPAVDSAVMRQMSKGVSLSLSGSIEAELAEMLVRLIPCAEMVRFGKNGSDATTAAVRLARAFTGREKIVVCGYHGWHDWYIGTTTKRAGVPNAVQKLSFTSPFNDADAFSDLLKAHGDDIAALIIEPTGKITPRPNFLKEVRECCDRHGIILIFDEVISGFRVNIGGAQAKYGVTPDLATFGKAMANGYPISALVGRRNIMSKMENIFFSATFGGELSSIAAAIATITKLENTSAISRIEQVGGKLTEKINTVFEEQHLSSKIQLEGEAWWPRIALKVDGTDTAILQALMRQEFTKQNLLIASGLNLCLAHDDEQLIEDTIFRVNNAAEHLYEALNSQDPSRYLRGEVAFSDFEVREHMRDGK